MGSDDLITRILAAIEKDALAGATRSCGDVHWQYAVHHPEGHPDESVLRHCEADKRTVERHRPSGVTVLVAGQERHFCAHCRVMLPCPDLLDRASAYDVTVQVPDGHHDH